MTKSAARKRSAQEKAKARQDPASAGAAATSHLTVVASDTLDRHPHCEHHGPALLFRETFDDPTKTPLEFYGCSANRDRHACRVRTAVDAADDEQRRAADYERRMAANAELLQMVCNHFRHLNLAL